LIVYGAQCGSQCGNPTHFYDETQSSTSRQINCDDDDYYCDQDAYASNLVIYSCNNNFNAGATTIPKVLAIGMISKLKINRINGKIIGTYFRKRYGDGSSINGHLDEDVFTIGSLTTQSMVSIGVITQIDAPNGFEAVRSCLKFSISIPINQSSNFNLYLDWR